MGMFDKAKDLAGEHDEKVDQGVEKAGDFADDKTGGGHAEHVDKGQDFIQGRTGEGDTVDGGGEGGGEGGGDRGGEQGQ